jgi:hypothetical protein
VDRQNRGLLSKTRGFVDSDVNAVANQTINRVAIQMTGSGQRTYQQGEPPEEAS